jgi:hypothetical protein
MPRFLAMVKATANSEAGVMPDAKLFEDMGRFNEQLVDAGVIQAADGLHPSSKGARVKFSKDNKRGRRWPIHGGQGPGRGLLDLEMRLPRRGNRVGKEMPEPASG